MNLFVIFLGGGHLCAIVYRRGKHFVSGAVAFDAKMRDGKRSLRGWGEAHGARLINMRITNIFIGRWVDIK